MKPFLACGPFKKQTEDRQPARSGSQAVVCQSLSYGTHFYFSFFTLLIWVLYFLFLSLALKSDFPEKKERSLIPAFF